MNLCTGNYKIPEMFPESFKFPNGYKIINKSKNPVWLTHEKSGNKQQLLIHAGESACLWLEEGQFITVDRTCEMVLFVPDEV